MRAGPGSKRVRTDHDLDWRDPAQITSQWREASNVDPAALRFEVEGEWWSVLEQSGVCLLVSREYEHLLVALASEAGRPAATHMAMPHPSGIAFDERRGVVHIASTRNPNQVFDLRPVTGTLDRHDPPGLAWSGRPLLPVASRYLPGSLYIHDLALIGGKLHANAVAHNAVVELEVDGRWRRRWWPRSIESNGEPDFKSNYLQLNSIAAGRSLASSAFSASGDRISARRPGHRNYPVDGRGVVYSGRTREPLAGGLTRPHSARYDGDGRLWVDDSGYGRLVTLVDDGFEVVAELDGWTRGLAIQDGIGFVGTSRVIPRFRDYAPGLDLERSVCGVHAVELSSGKLLGSLIWPNGNQVFAVEAIPAAYSLGFPFASGRAQSANRLESLFYSFETEPDAELQ